MIGQALFKPELISHMLLPSLWNECFCVVSTMVQLVLAFGGKRLGHMKPK